MCVSFGGILLLSFLVSVFYGFLILPSSCSVLLCADLERLKVFAATTAIFLEYSLLIFNQNFMIGIFLKTLSLTIYVNQEPLGHGSQPGFFGISADCN